jgi:RimJ/RimL family protein N-acetyltransferase
MLPKTIETTRLKLRKPMASDAAVLFESYGQDPEVSKYTTWRPLSRESEAENFISKAIEDWEKCQRFTYALEANGSQEQLIGMLDARLNGHIVIIGYVIAKKYWGKGLMPEAVSALVSVVLQLDQFFRIQATCDVDNLASIRTLEKCGFINEGRLERYTIHPNTASKPRPCFMFARCK